MTLSKYEQETIITFNAEEKTAEIYTADLVQIRRLDSLCAVFPEIYKLKKQDEISKTYTVSKITSHFASRELFPKDSEKGLLKI